ncbi:Aste57867_22859 [Aphanomyces stellatus]|uniref:Vacuolar protein 8 n=1 Tax=Aphanomyces stellatus TaxID=120398 RepID=A0A485LLP7_9STRA|nr:hypothetical protein As57867_022788 [Aphanomyces stellatus]VFT99509.1 Aste57867_22859 [Aphanomyces stellatus]
MSHRLSQAARHTQELLEDLERDKELDVIRIYLARFDLFPRSRDPKTAPIRSEELRDLVKHWKLHRQRNFWKNHTTKEDLVRMLYKHITTKVLPTETNAPAPLAAPAAPLSPTRPVSGAGLSNNRRTSARHIDQSSQKFSPTKLNALGLYGGDLFAQRGDYDSGMIYVSRLAPPETDLTFQNVAQTAVDATVKDTTLFPELDVLDEDAAQREKRLMTECACSLYQLTLEPGHEADIVREGCVPAIVRMCTFDDIDVKKFCSATIVNVSVDYTLTPRLIEEGVLGGLMELAKVQQEDIRRNAAIGICRISYDRQGQHKLIQEGSVPALISMLNNTDFETKEACVKTLVNISSFSGAVVSESVTHTVTRIAAKKDPAFDRFIVETICNMSLLTGPRNKAADDGILDPIHDINRGCAELDIKRMIAVALSNFSGIETNHMHMCSGRILHCLDSLLGVDDVSIKEMAATAVANISCTSDLIAKLVAPHDEAINLPLRLIQSGYNAADIIQENISAALLNISLSCEAHRLLLTQNGVVLLLIHFLETSNYLTKLHAIVLLCSLMDNDLPRAQLVQHDVVRVVVALAATPATRELCAVALFNFSCFADTSPYLLAPETMDALTLLFTGSTKDHEKDVCLCMTQEFTLNCLYNLSFHAASADILVGAGLVHSFCHVFRKSCKSPEAANLRAAATLCNMSFTSNTDLLQRMLDEDVLKLLKRLPGSAPWSKELVLCITTTLCNLAVPALQTSGQVLPVMLIEFSHTPHADVAFVCAISFSKLASHPTLREALAKVLDLPPTLTVMMRSGIEDVQIHCAAALCGLACERGPKTNKYMWKEGTTTDFIVNSLLRINSDSTKEVCARVLFNVLTHEDCRGQMIKDGVLYALVKLARLESLEIRTLCVTALYNLSCDDTMLSVLMDINVAHVISKMCENEFSHVESRRKLAACLTNIALRPGFELKLMEGGGLTAVLLLCDHGDVECMRYSASVLCSLSTTPPNCDGLAHVSALELLLKMTNSKDSYQCLFALHALCNISCVPALHDKIEEAETICTIVRVLGESEEEDILLTCSKILCNLTYHAKHHATILKHQYATIVLQSLKKTLFQSVADVSARIVATLSEDPAAIEPLVSGGAVEVLHLAAKAGGPSTVTHCVISLCRLTRGAATCTKIVQDGLFDILSAAIPLATTATKLPLDLSERCSMILRALSTFPVAIADLVADDRLMPLAAALAHDGDKETCKNVVMLLHNITAARSREFQREARRNGVIPLLIKLAKLCSTEELQICAVALAHINSELSEAERREIEDYHQGLVFTLVSMLEMDPPMMQRVEKVALALPSPLVIARVVNDFLAGANATRVLTQIPVSWQIQNAHIDEASLVPKEPKHYLAILPQRHTEFHVAIKEGLFGSFQILQVAKEKSRMTAPMPKLKHSMNTILNLVDVLADEAASAVTAAGTAPPSTLEEHEDEDNADAHHVGTPKQHASRMTPTTPRSHHGCGGTPGTPGSGRDDDDIGDGVRRGKGSHKAHIRGSGKGSQKQSSKAISLTKGNSVKHIRPLESKQSLDKNSMSDSFSILPRI